MSLISQTLSDFGLTKNEIAIYLEAIKHAEVSPFSLARLTKIPRTTVYDVMMSLALKGLITVKTSQGLEKQQTWIIPKNPSVLRDTLQKRRSELMRLEVNMVDILTDLKGKYLSHENNSFCRFMPGMQGVKKAYAILNEIPPRVPIYFFDHCMPMDTLGKKYINAEVSHTMKKKMGGRVKTLIPLNDWTHHVVSYQYGRDTSYIKFHEYRYLDNPTFELHHDMYVMKDKIIIICAKEDEVWACVITSRLVASSFTSMFHVLWQQATPITSSIIKNWGENEFLKEERKLK